MQRWTLLPVYSLLEENTPFVSPREGRGEAPSTPDIAGVQLEGLHALRNESACVAALLRSPPLGVC